MAAAAEELHRRNEAARLIEARSQEPVVRGVRLVATGLVDQPARVPGAPAAAPRPVAHRRVYTGTRWSDEAPVFLSAALGEGATVVGPALVQSPFTTVVLAEGDTATAHGAGDLMIEVAGPSR